jgi:hypothetical protein
MEKDDKQGCDVIDKVINIGLSAYIEKELSSQVSVFQQPT